MKTLPDSPSLDHLRQQAKDLVTQMRVLRPDATLSEARTGGGRAAQVPDLARSHGRGRPSMRRPRIAEDSLADAVAATWPMWPLIGVNIEMS